MCVYNFLVLNTPCFEEGGNNRCSGSGSQQPWIITVIAIGTQDPILLLKGTIFYPEKLKTKLDMYENIAAIQKSNFGPSKTLLVFNSYKLYENTTLTGSGFSKKSMLIIYYST